MPDLLTELRAHLAAHDIVRSPDQPGSEPPFWLEPRLGVRAPGDGDPPERGDDAVLGAFITGGIPPRPYESWQRRRVVDIRFRTTTAPRALDLDTQIRAVLIDRRDWMLGALHVIESQVWREFQPLGADEQAFDFVTAFVFQLYDQP